MLTKLKELLFALLLSPAVYYYGLEGTLFFVTCLGLYVLAHVSREVAREVASAERVEPGAKDT